MKATNFKNTSGSQYVTIQYKKDGSWTDVKTDAEALDEVTLGSVSFTVTSTDKDTKAVVLTTTTTGVSFNRLYSDDGLFIQLISQKQIQIPLHLIITQIKAHYKTTKDFHSTTQHRMKIQQIHTYI